MDQYQCVISRSNLCFDHTADTMMGSVAAETGTSFGSLALVEALTPLEPCLECCNTSDYFPKGTILRSLCKLGHVFHQVQLDTVLIASLVFHTIPYIALGAYMPPRPISLSPILRSILLPKTPRSNNLVDLVSMLGRPKSTRESSVGVIISRSSLLVCGKWRDKIGYDFANTDQIVGFLTIRDTVSALGITKLPNLPFASAVGYVRYFRQALSLDER